MSYPTLGRLIAAICVSSGLLQAASTTNAQETSAQADADSPADDGKTYSLAYKFQPNEYVYYDVVHTSTISTRAGEFSERAFNETKTRKHFRVISVDDEGAGLLESTLDRVQMTVKFDDNPAESFDSADKQAKDQQKFKTIRESIGKPAAAIRFASNGKLLGLNAINVSSGNGADSGNQLFLIVLPEEPVAVGDEWKDDVKLAVNVARNLKQKITLRRTYRLDSVKEGLATISLRTVVLSPVNDSQLRIRLIQSAPKGKIVFDLDRGKIVSKTLEIDKTELGVIGDASSMRAVSKRTVRLVSPEEIADAKPKPRS